MKRLIFWGATGQARVLYEALQASDYRLIATFDNRQVAPPLEGVPLLIGQENFLTWLAEQNRDEEILFCVAIGGSRGSDRVQRQYWLRQQGLHPLTILHARAFVAKTASVGAGSQVLAMAAVCANARIGEATIINTAATVDHDCVLGDGVHVAPGAHLAGEIRVDDHAFIGMGALILPRLHIGRNAVVGAGSVVTRDVAPGGVVKGSPAKPVENNATPTS